MWRDLQSAGPAAGGCISFAAKISATDREFALIDFQPLLELLIWGWIKLPMKCQFYAGMNIQNPNYFRVPFRVLTHGHMFVGLNV